MVGLTFRNLRKESVRIRGKLRACSRTNWVRKSLRVCFVKDPPPGGIMHVDDAEASSSLLTGHGNGVGISD